VGSRAEAWVLASENPETPMWRDNVWYRGMKPRLGPIGLGRDAPPDSLPRGALRLAVKAASSRAPEGLDLDGEHWRLRCCLGCRGGVLPCNPATRPSGEVQETQSPAGVAGATHWATHPESAWRRCRRCHFPRGFIGTILPSRRTAAGPGSMNLILPGTRVAGRKGTLGIADADVVEVGLPSSF